MPLISVIVPVYNAEKYLHRCIDSILGQTFRDFELLLIDDGSPDYSGKICDDYAAKDSRVRVFHKKNGGVSTARQVGLNHALGEYTIHADPDDWVECNMLEELYAQAIENAADMVICDYYEEHPHRSIYIPQLLTRLAPSFILRDILLRTVHGSLCNKLIRRSCFSTYNITFPLDISLWEDRYVCCELLLHDIKVVKIDKAYYHYDNYSNESSLVRTNHANGIKSQKRFIQHFLEKLDWNEYAEELYTIKAETKDKAFVCPSYSKNEFITLYNEINYRYRSDRSDMFNVRFYASLVLILNNKHIPYVIYRILWTVRVLLRRLYLLFVRE